MRIPHHIGIIPDGNRRWAQAHGMGREMGYEYGLEPGLKALRHAKELGIQEITCYGFTVDNCKRSKKQVEAFQKACVEAIDWAAQEGVSLLVIGNAQSRCFPRELLPFTRRTTVGKGGIRVNFLVNYGWEWDLSNIRNCGKPYSQDIGRVDLIVRWGGMRRLSGFLPIQSVYADFFVEEKLWPDYADEDLDRALEWYNRQDITLGG